jgi:FkbM family methyltransferase
MFITSEGYAVVDHDTHFKKWVIESKRLDHDIHTLNDIAIHIERNRSIVDIGANIGTHTIYYERLVVDGAKVLAFEVNPPAYECLAHNCKKAFSIPVGLSNCAELISLAVSNNVGATHIISSSSSPNKTEQSNFACVALDSFKLNNVGYIKIDVEGYELKVLLGGKRTIVENQPLLWVELSPGHLRRSGTSIEEVLSFLDSIDYSPLYYIGVPAQSDAMFVPNYKFEKHINIIKNSPSFKGNVLAGSSKERLEFLQDYLSTESDK